MRESVIYQKILQEGREIGLQQGLQAELSLILRAWLQSRDLSNS